MNELHPFDGSSGEYIVLKMEPIGRYYCLARRFPSQPAELLKGQSRIIIYTNLAAISEFVSRADGGEQFSTISSQDTSEDIEWKLRKCHNLWQCMDRGLYEIPSK
jgi:hypothetical protein